MNPERSLRNWRLENYSIIRDETLENSVKDILAKISNNGISFNIQPEIYISSSTAFEAYTLDDGGIFVSAGMLAQLEYEDELAALLAHELSHLYLNHHGKDSTQKITDKVVTAGQYRNRLEGKEASEKNLALAKSVTDQVLFLSWNRNQEQSADFLGIDLLIEAGYNADGMILLLKKIKNYDDQMLLEKGIDLDDSEENKQKAMTKFVKSFFVESSDNYNDPDKRIKMAREYIRSLHKNRSRNEMKSVSFANSLVFKVLFDLNKIDELMASGNDNKANALVDSISLVAVKGNPYAAYVLYDFYNNKGDEKKLSPILGRP